MTDALGAITWWGFSPSLNLFDILGNPKTDELNILLVGGGDIRHILSTISHSSRLQTPPVLHFYVLESSLELYARHLLFLALILTPQCEMGLQEKCELFLEIYGNVLIRQQSCDYIMKMANHLIKMITDFDYFSTALPCADCSQLKFKERDFLEGIFKFWRKPEIEIFDVEKYWDLRMRKIMGGRYDSRMNTYDWDYHMRLCERQGEVINRFNYRTWRHTGVAFDIRDGAYTIPNKTLASGLIINDKEGEKCARRGYWGDMMVGPYVAVALETEQPDLLKKQNGVYAKTSQEIAEYNMTAIFHEILNKTKYEEPEKPDIGQSATLTEISEETEEESEIPDRISSQMDQLKLQDEYESIPLENIKVTFLSLGSLPDLHKKAKYNNLFDLIYFSNSMVHLFTQDLTQTFKDNAKVVVETAKFMLELKKEQYTAYVAKVTDMAAASHCESTGEVDALKDVFLKFNYHKKTTSDS